MLLRSAVIILILIAVWTTESAAQSVSPKASAYFPPEKSAWQYRQSVLDTLQTPIDSLTSFRRDSLAVVIVNSMDDFEITSQAIVTVSNAVPDTALFITHQNTILRSLDLAPLSGIFEIDSTVLRRFSATYVIMDFNAGVNVTDTLLAYDTTVTVDSMTLPLRFAFTRKRLTEQTIVVPAGSFTAMPFVYRFTVSLMYGTILGTVRIPLAEFTDSTFVAKNAWIVKRIIPATVIPAPSPFLSLLPTAIPSFTIPGMAEELQSLVITSVPSLPAQPQTFVLEQNYPNPFNPSTVIRFTAVKPGSAVITIHDILGRVVERIEREVTGPGTAEIRFTPDGLSSGIYFYTVQYQGSTHTKRMLYQR